MDSENYRQGSTEVNREEYYKLINEYAHKCIELDPDDPTQFSMEFANGESTISVADALTHTSSLAQAQLQWDSDNTIDQEQYDFYVSVDAIDWDICKRIRELQLTDKEAELLLNNGETINLIDGTVITDMEEFQNQRKDTH